MPRSGHVALAGRPNAGKSSLLNALVGAHLAIVSPKPQSTRMPVIGLLTRGDTQVVLHDLPGLLDPTYALQERMRGMAQEELARVRAILHLQPANEGPAPPFWPLTGLPSPLATPVLTVYTKIDLAAAPDPGALAVSATTGQGLEALVAALEPHLPEQPFEFDAEDVGTQPLRFFAAEYLREAAFELLGDEVPYALTAEVEEFRENAKPVYIRVSLLVERDSQKGIVIGAGGRTLKAIGQHARARLEDLLGEQVFLDCWVKVSRDWRRKAHLLTALGFPEPRGTRS